MAQDYEKFIHSRTQCGSDSGFDPLFMPDILFPFQVALTEWAVRRGRAAIFADCGLGKTFMQLAWAENAARHTGGRVLVLTPLAVWFQTVAEGEKIGVEVTHRTDGIDPGDRIVVTNYERLHHFDTGDFSAVVLDESSILKNFDGATRKAVTEFMRKTPYRLLCTATAAPNDYVELGTSSEALGEMGAADMVSKFFRKSKATTSARQEHMSGLYQLRAHATRDFWRWVCSWARAVRKPSDIGCQDDGFALPPLNIRSHVVKASRPREGYLFDIPAVGLAEQRSDLKNTLNERCEMAASLINSHNEPAISWCNLNGEGDMLTRMIEGAEQVAGKDTDEHKERVFADFIRGDIRVLVTKPSIGGFGLNFQHCAHQTYFPSHSYEQYYQSLRRCWRYGQKNTVTVDMITTDGQNDVLANLQRKSEQADELFSKLVEMMWRETKIQRVNEYTKSQEVPSWL